MMPHRRSRAIGRGSTGPLKWVPNFTPTLPHHPRRQRYGRGARQMDAHFRSPAIRIATWGTFGLLGLAVLPAGCGEGGGESGDLTPQAAPTPQLEQAAVQNLLDLYRTATLQEDIDRLQELLDRNGGAFEGTSFLDTLADTFRRLMVTDLQLMNVALEGSPMLQSVTFLEVLSVADPVALEQRTLAARTRWQLSRRVEQSGTVMLLIGRVVREGPRFQVMMRGHVVAGAPVRVEVTETTATGTVTGVTVEEPETGVM
jgi:hypothetical protein